MNSSGDRLSVTLALAVISEDLDRVIFLDRYDDVVVRRAISDYKLPVSPEIDWLLASCHKNAEQQN